MYFCCICVIFIYGIILFIWLSWGKLLRLVLIVNVNKCVKVFING